MRKHYIDNLRWLAILLLIPYHAAMAWNTWGEPNYIYFESNKLISSIPVFFSSFFMPLLFALAGMSTRFALQKRTLRQYVCERTRKLLLPFVFGTLLFMPVMTYIADKYNCGYEGNLFQHYRVFFTKFTDLTGADGGFSVGQFWFILYLYFISLVSVGIIRLLHRLFIDSSRTNTIDLPLWLVCFLGLPLPLLNKLLSVGGKSFVEYLYIFLIGYYILSKDSFMEKIEIYKCFFLCAGLSATVLNVYLFLWSDMHVPRWNTFARFLSEWFMLMALLGTGKAYFNFSGKVSQYMSRRSFLFYMLHFIWIVFFQYVLSDVWADNTMLLYLGPVLLAYAATLLFTFLCQSLEKWKRS